MTDNARIVLISQVDQDVKLAQNPAVILHLKQKQNQLICVHQSTYQRVENIQLPKPTFSLDEYITSPNKDWLVVLDNLVSSAGNGIFALMDFDHPLSELFLLADACNIIPFGLYFPIELPRALPHNYALIGRSRLNVFDNKELESDFQKKYVGPYCSATPNDDLSDILSAASLQSEDQPSSANLAIEPSGTQRPIRLLIISYFSGPCRTVGVQRVNYWVEELKKISGGRIETHLATAIDWNSPEINVHYVPDHHMGSLFDGSAEVPEWGAAFVATEKRQLKSFNTLSYYWRYALERHFDTLDEEFDVVLISGNPFAVFDFAAYAKRRWYANVILDYRDPFANNPRMKFRPEAREHARYVEKGYNLQADLAIVVNDDCRKLLVINEELQTMVIPNGYDERVVNSIENSDPADCTVRFVHAGQIYPYGPLDPLTASLTVGRHEFHHIGATDKLPNDVQASDLVMLHGRLSYRETLKEIAKSQCGVIYLSEEAFETTTKVFDYIALGLDIIIFTAQKPPVTQIYELLRDRDGVYWCQNDPDSILGFLASYVPSSAATKAHRRRQVAQFFSRQVSAEKLIQHIFRLVTCEERLFSDFGDGMTV